MKPGQSGDCRVRINIDGVLTTVVYGFPCSIHVDPMEKKPLFHFFPGSQILSLTTVGCNLHCRFCQNWEISQANPEDAPAAACPPDKLVTLTRQYSCPSIAYTYTDPVVYYEYAYDCAAMARANGIRNVLVTAGYINPEPWRKLLKVTDAANIDLKGITEEFYRDVCSATLQPVLDALILAKVEGIELEITNLLVPTLNDQPERIRQLVKWIRANLGSDTPLHFSRFFPRYQMQNLPPTSPQTLDTARSIALDEGLKYVYIGNIASNEGQNTYCPGCSKLLIERSGFTIQQNHIRNGKCPNCNQSIYGVWQ